MYGTYFSFIKTVKLTHDTNYKIEHWFDLILSHMDVIEHWLDLIFIIQDCLRRKGFYWKLTSKLV